MDRRIFHVLNRSYGVQCHFVEVTIYGTSKNSLSVDFRANFSFCKTETCQWHVSGRRRIIGTFMLGDSTRSFTASPAPHGAGGADAAERKICRKDTDMEFIEVPYSRLSSLISSLPFQSEYISTNAHSRYCSFSFAHFVILLHLHNVFVKPEHSAKSRLCSVRGAFVRRPFPRFHHRFSSVLKFP